MVTGITREMTQEEVDEMVRLAEISVDEPSRFVSLESKVNELKYWRRIQSGELPRRQVSLDFKPGVLRK